MNIEKQRILEKLVSRNVIHCCSAMVYDLANNSAFCDDQLLELTAGRPDYENPCREEGWVPVRELCKFGQLRAKHERGDDVTFVKLDKGCQVDASFGGDWQELALDERIDPEYQEILEHWIVDPWFARKLSDFGEVTGELFDFTIWGRTTTGQAICLDGVIHDIAASMEILPGQKNEWKV